MNRPDTTDWMMAIVSIGGVLLVWLGMAVVIGMLINLARAGVVLAIRWIDWRREKKERRRHRALSVRVEDETRCERVGRRAMPATSGVYGVRRSLSSASGSSASGCGAEPRISERIRSVYFVPSQTSTFDARA